MGFGNGKKAQMDTIGLKIKIFEKIFKFHRVKNRLDPRM
jgi:hypothetical protein